MVKKYIPERGDVVFLDFNPQSGREQWGKRPALVITPKTYNSKIGLMLVCPITSKIKNYPFEVLLPDHLRTKGVVLVDHVRNVDWQSRKARYLEKLPPVVIDETLQKLAALLAPTH